MARSYDMSGGSDQDGMDSTDQGDVIDHPAHNLPHPMQPRRPTGTQMAGDVIPIRPADSAINSIAASRQLSNQRAMDDIAARGPSSVDPKNLAIIPNDRYK